MSNYNKVIIIGNLTRDPEVKYTTAGNAIAEISLAVNRKWKDTGGEQKEETTFIDVTLFARTAEIVGDFARKGSKMLVEGRLHLDTWEDKTTGKKRTKLKVIGENTQFLGSKSDGGKDNKGNNYGTSKPPKEHHPLLDDDDEIPF